MSKKISTLRFNDEVWDVNLPSVRAYSFSQNDIAEFVRSNKRVPFVYDTNLINACNVNCAYCSTQGGKADVRFPEEKNIPYVRDNQFKDLIEQFGELGVRTFFICSNGEPLLKPDRFMDIVDRAADQGVNIVTYTNASTLEPKLLRRLHQKNVNLVMKLESLNPQNNDNIIVSKAGRGPKKGFSGYEYTNFEGQEVPVNLVQAFEEYGSDYDMLALETMILKDNMDEVLDIRRWGYENLGVAQFLKHLYPLGYTQLKGINVRPELQGETQLKPQIYQLDSEFGMRYPDFDTPDNYSYDARRLMNNVVNKGGFPFRMFGHERGGIFHSSEIIPVKFGFGTDNVIGCVRDGKVVAKQYFQDVGSLIEENR